MCTSRRSLIALCVLLVTVLACSTFTPSPSPVMLPGPTVLPTPIPPSATPEPPPPTFGIPPTPPSGVRGPSFAAYPEIPVFLPAAYDGYALPLDLATVGFHPQITLSDEARALLAQKGFVVTVPRYPNEEFDDLYSFMNYTEVPAFITTDSVYHVYHLILDKMLRDLERQSFEPDIRLLTRACLQAAIDLHAEVAGTELEGPIRKVIAYFAVADALISPDDPAPVPPDVADMVAGELAQVAAHEGLKPSPIFGANCPESCDPCDPNPPPGCLDQPCMCEDYSQYIPRGHYTRSEQLQRYFRTMMWYGRINMRLQKPDETRVALLITYILRNTGVNGTPAADVWARVYDPTVFIVGKADDLGFHEYGVLWDSVFGPDAPPSAIADEAKFGAFVQAARNLPPPQINSMWVYIWEDPVEVTQGFRFMGQRFVLDAYIFDEMTAREVGEEGNFRRLPKGLDVMAALGSEEAYAILDEMGEAAYVNYPEQMAKLRGEVEALEMDSWSQSLYWAWLYAFEPLLEPKGVQYPAFMQTQAWTRKGVHTALGSWTELKHDTILYAKQSMPTAGGGPEEPSEVSYGWVEPNPAAYARLLALARMTRDGLQGRGLLTENTDANLQRLDDLLTFLLDVSQRELAGEPLTEGDYERIRHYGQELWSITVAAADKEGEDDSLLPYQPEPAALVADVATTDLGGLVLEEATGYIDEIYVVIPDGRGGLHVAKGGVFSYYEFPWPIADRLTDEKWREMLEDGNAPDRPEWVGSFIVE